MRAYTLVELLVALTLSLLLLGAVAAMFQRVGGSMSEVRSGMSASVQLTEAALLLRQDLARIPSSLATKPHRIADASEEEISDNDGYLEIIEGPNTSSVHPFRNAGEHDYTVGDTDDIIAFTITDYGIPFRGLVRVGEGDNSFLTVQERTAAEIVWFMRGNTLYRRIRLLNDLDPARGEDVASDRRSTGRGVARRENRTLHMSYDATDSPTNRFPFPLYDSSTAYRHWYYLRVPILEEILDPRWRATARQWKTVSMSGDTTLSPHPDLWEQPHFFPGAQDSQSGALNQFVSSPYRHSRAGEDAVLTNVLSFDVKVWCPTVRDFVDLGTGSWVDSTGLATRLHGQGGYVWDSWSQSHMPPIQAGGLPPPYAEPLEAIQITIRTFDPVSRKVKQVTVVHRF